MGVDPKVILLSVREDSRVRVTMYDVIADCSELPKPREIARKYLQNLWMYATGVFLCPLCQCTQSIHLWALGPALRTPRNSGLGRSHHRPIGMSPETLPSWH